jgi:fructokinase
MTIGGAEDGRLVAGVELGGTKCVCTLAGGPDAIIEQVRIETQDPATTLGAVRAVLEGWQGIAAVGLASFGPVDLDPASPLYGHIVNTPKPGWSGADVIGVATGLGVPVAIDTDVNAAAVAEGRWGAAQGLDSFAYVTVGTGVGVGPIVRGRAVRGLGHAEAGHLRIARAAGDAWPGICPYHGDCVEGLAAGPAIEARAGQRGELLADDDPALLLAAHALGGLCHNLVFSLAPERILIGGGVFVQRPQLLARVRAALVASLNGYGVAPAIAAGIETFLSAPALGGQAGPLGSIAIAQDAIA